MKKLAILLLFPSLAFAQVQVQGKPGGAIQIGGNQPGVSSIQDLTGPFTFTGAGFTGCTFDSGAGLTTCTFAGGTGGVSSVNSLTGDLNLIGDGGMSVYPVSPSSIYLHALSPVVNYANDYALVGAFTDSSGNVILPISIGTTSQVTFAVPHGATQLQLGVSDDNYADNSGSWTVAVNGTNYTVQSTAQPWTHAGGINAQYPTGSNSATSPTVVPISNISAPVTIQYVSGTVVSDLPPLCGGLTGVSMTTAGYSGCIWNYGVLYSPFYMPNYWAAYPNIASGSAFTLTTTGTSGVATYSGGVLNIPNYSGNTPPGGSTGQLQYNNGGAFGGDSGSTTDGAGNVTTKTLSTTGTAGVAGRVSIQQGTTPANIANNVSIIGPSSTTPYRIQIPGVQPTSGNTYLSCTAADPAVCTWAAGGGGGGGGYTNVTGSASQTTVSALNTLCGTGTLYITTPLSIATGGTITCPTQFSKSGVITVAAAQTVTFSLPITETDAPSQHFAGSGSVVITKQDARPEWWNAKGDWNGTTGTDDHVALQACMNSVQSGNCLLQSKGYYMGTTCNLTYVNNYTGLVGNYGSEPTQVNTSTLICGSASATIISMVGSGLPNNLRYPVLKNVNIGRSVAPAAGSIGVDVQHTGGGVIEGNNVTESAINFKLQDVEAWEIGYVSHNAATWGYGNVTGYCSSSIPLVGYQLIGTQSSLKMSWNGSSNGLSIGGGNYCQYTNAGTISGSHPTDIIVSNQDDFRTKGWDISTTDNIWDVHFSNITEDSGAQCMNIHGPAANSGMAINFDGTNWCFSTASPGITISNAANINLQNWQMWNYGVTISNSRDLLVSGLTWLEDANGTANGDGIDLTSVSNSVFSNIPIRLNDATGTAFKLVSSSNNSFSGISCAGTMLYCWSADASSNNNTSLSTIQSQGVSNNNLGSGNTISVTNTTNLNGGALGSVPYQSAANTTAMLSGNTTTTNKFLTQTGTGSVSAAPAWGTIASGDLTAAFTTPPAIGGTTPAAGAFTTLKATSIAAGTGTNCLQIDTAGVLSNTGSACGAGGGGGSNVQVNGGSTLTTANLNDSSPALPTGATGVHFQNSGSGVSAYLNRPQFKQYTFVSGSGSSSVASITSPSITTVAGDVVVVFCRAATGPSSITVTDSQSNTWNSVATVGTNPIVKMAWSKITNAGSTTFTCTPNSSVAHQGMVVGDFGWTSTTVSSVGSGSSTSSDSLGGWGTHSFINAITTTGQGLALSCASVTSEASTFMPGAVLGVPGTLYGISQSTLSGNDDTGCQFAFVPYAVPGGSANIYYVSGSVSPSAVTGVLAY